MDSYEINSIEDEIMRWADISSGEELDEEIPLEELESDDLVVYASTDVTCLYPFREFCKALKTSQVTSLSLDCSQNEFERATVAQVLSVASEISRSRLRVAQVLAFCCALNDRMGADSAICDMVDKGVVDIWQIVASIVHARHGHEGLCSTLACQNPWYEVCVRGLVPEGVPHSWECQ